MIPDWSMCASLPELRSALGMPNLSVEGWYLKEGDVLLLTKEAIHCRIDVFNGRDPRNELRRFLTLPTFEG